MAGQDFSDSFKTDALADSFRSNLVSAVRRGVAFDVTRGLPITMLEQQDAGPSWYEHACAFVDAKWRGWAPGSRRSVAEALATVTPALLESDQGRPDPALLRETLYGWAFNAGRRAREPAPAHLAGVVSWVASNTVPMSALAGVALVRAALDTLALKLDGTPAAANTVIRKRAVLYNALEFAVERGDLPTNPLDRIKWKAPRVAGAVDRRVVVNHRQARALLAAVSTVEPRLVGFFACMYYAALRPGEVLALRDTELDVPEVGWGTLNLTGSNPTGAAGRWTDSGQRETRGLKHRAATDTRLVPCPPALTQILHRHLGQFGTGPDGRLFHGARGGPVPESTYGEVWRTARHQALTPAEAASPLAGRPYDLRHAAVSTWLNAGVPATQVAEWAGHSVHVLLRVYAKCVLGQDEAARRRVEAALALGSTDATRPTDRG